VLSLGVLASLQGNDAVFLPLVFLHAISALAGFGSIGFAGTYASRAARLYDTYDAGAPAGTPVEAQAGPGVTGAPVTAAAETLSEAASAAAPSAAAAPEFAPGALPLASPETRAGAWAEGEAQGEGPARTDPEVEELTRYFERPARFWKAVLLVPVFGLLALWAEPRTAGLDQVWVLAALLVWVCATLLVVGLVVPGLRQMSALLRAPQPAAGTPAAISQRARMARAGSMASRGAAFCDVLFFVALALMIWRP